MARRLFKIASFVSLVPCLAAALLWVRSGRVYDRFICTTDGHTYELATGRGCARIEWTNQWAAEGDRLFHWEHGEIARYEAEWDGIDSFWIPGPHSGFHGFAAGKWIIPVFGLQALRPGERLVEPPPIIDRFVMFPLWVAMVLWLSLPGLYAFICMRRRKLRLSGHCPACGYDLRASTERCSECGTPIPRSTGEKT